MRKKKNKTVSISGNVSFVCINLLLLLVFIGFVVLSIYDQCVGLFIWPEQYENAIATASQVITGIISLVVSIVGIAISLQNDDYFGIKITKLYRLRVEKHYSIIGIIILSISLSALNLAFYMLGMTVAAIGSIVVSLGFLFKVIFDEVPLMMKSEVVYMKILKDNIISCYLQKKEASKDLKDSIKFLLYGENLKGLYNAFKDDRDEEYNLFLLMKLLEYQQDLAFELSDKYDENTQSIISSSLLENVLDLMFKHVELTEKQNKEIFKNKYLLTRVLFRINDIPMGKKLLHRKIPGVFQSLSFKTNCKDEDDLIVAVMISLVAGTIKEEDFGIVSAIRRHLSSSEWELRNASPGLNLFVIISVYLYYLCNSEPDVPNELKKKILTFIDEGGFVEENTRIISWKHLFEFAGEEFNVDYNEFITLALNNEQVLEYWLWGTGAKSVVFDSVYLTRWYLTHFINSRRTTSFDCTTISDINENNRYSFKNFGDSCFDEKQRFKPTEEMKRIINFYYDDFEPFELFQIYEKRSHSLFDFINGIKLDELREEKELAKKIDEEKFAAKIKQGIENAIVKEWGYDSTMEISNSNRYFSVLLEKIPQALNFESSIIEYSIRSVFGDLRRSVKKTEIFNDIKFEDSIKEVLSKELKFITSNAKNSIPYFYISDEKLKSQYENACNHLVEFESKILGMTTLVIEGGFSFNCIIDKVEIRKLNEDELAEQVKKYQREDGQYVYDGTFLPQEEIAPLVEAKYCVLTVIMKHQVDSSEETVFELNPYSAGKKDKE